MLVDINANVGHWPFQQLQYSTLEGLIERMDRFGVDISVVANLNGVFYKNPQSANEELSRWLSSRSLSARFVPFAVLNPAYAGWRDDLKTCRDRLGMKGVRLYPKYHDYAIDDPACIELVKAARDLGMIVAFTLRMVDNRQRFWMDISQEWSLKDVMPIVKAVPDAKYLILNIANGPVLNPEDTELLRKSNLIMDTSGRALNDLAGAIARYGAEKFAFGTHAPIQDYLTGLLRIEAMTDAEADSRVKDRLRFQNAKSILGI